MLLLVLKKILLSGAFCLLGASTLSISARASSKWGGYLEGGYNFLGNQTYFDSRTREEKKVEGNTYWAEAGAFYFRDTKRLSIKAEGKVRVNDLHYALFSAPEVKVTQKFSSWSMSYGRLILGWSDVDRTWELGMINSRTNFDFFDSGQEGLTGLLLQSKRRLGFNWGVFGSILYIPELNPGQDVDDESKTITSKSPWTTETADYVTISGVRRRILYDVNMPSISKILFNYSLGLKLGYRGEKFYFHGFFMRKPENNITLGAGVNLDTSQNTLIANVEPRLFYHDIMGGEIGYRFKNNFLLKFSGVFVTPESEPEDSYNFSSSVTNLKAGKRQENYLGASLTKYGKNYRLALRYIARISDFDRTNDILASMPRWSQALGLFAQARFGKKLRITFDGRYDSLSKDRLARLDISYKFNNYFILRGGIESIGGDLQETSFWTPFSNNDSAYIAGRILF